jgi:uncharacterized protein YbjT (DUF2867 family)
MEQIVGRLALLTGATGYVGGWLLSKLEQRGVRVRCLTRRPEALRGRVGATTEAVAGDALEPASLEAAPQGVDTAYYFVHSMGAVGDFADADRRAETNLAQAARAAGVRRIICLGGLGNPDETLSYGQIMYEYARQQGRRPGAACASAPDWLIRGRRLSTYHRTRRLCRFAALAAGPAGTMLIGCGRCAVFSTCCAAASVSVEAVGIQRTSK